MPQLILFLNFLFYKFDVGYIQSINAKWFSCIRIYDWIMNEIADVTEDLISICRPILLINTYARGFSKRDVHNSFALFTFGLAMYRPKLEQLFWP